jgi:hypothetical protein
MVPGERALYLFFSSVRSLGQRNEGFRGKPFKGSILVRCIERIKHIVVYLTFQSNSRNSDL